jgi:hypothetical protein
MADTRCPMCGKLNPGDASACQYCGARLKPLQPADLNRPETGNIGGPAPPRREEPEGESDWMDDLRGDMMRNRPKTSMLPPEPPAPTPSDDWLQKIDNRGESKPPARGLPRRITAQPAPPPAESETPEKPAPAPKPQEAPLEPPAWLSKVRAQVSAERQRTPTAEPEKSDQEPVWLKRLRVRRVQDELAPAPPPAPEPEPATPGELPEWLSKIREKSSVSEPQTGEDQSFLGSPLPEGAPEFPPGFGGKGSAMEPPASPWGTPAPAQKPREDESGITEWMKYPSEASGAVGAPGAEPPVGTPDWMGDIASALKETPPTPPPAKPGAGPAGRPSTSSLLGGSGTERKTGPRPTGRILPPTKPFHEPIPPSPIAPSPSPFGPDWEFPTGGPTEFPFPGPTGETSGTAGSAAFLGGTEPIVAPGGEEEIPDWLAEAKREPVAPPAPESEPEPAEPTPDLNELLRPDAMPDWLHKPTEAEKQPAAPGTFSMPPAQPENLEHAELPRWLEAMRPIQSVAVPTEDEERVESVGPLAGLRGVLSAEPVVAMPRRPGIMAGNIDATPSQMTLTETLRRLLIEPEIRSARRPARAMLLAPIIRKAMSAVLILSILLPIATGNIFSNSAFQSPANLQAGQLVAALPADRMVLAAFEYDASEIETGATVILEHLAQRGIPVVFISSQPNGTMLGDGLLQVNQQLGVAMPTLAADFGYIPGGAGGLRRLGGDLRQAVPNPSLDWNNGPLSSIHSISDFSMILIFAGSPQAVRDWVEQVHTAAPNTPIVAMVSAASDALVFPYTQGTQPAIHGLVTGYSGARAYRASFLPATISSEGVYAMRWQAFGSGIVALLTTLAAGIIGSLVLGYLRRDRRTAG